MKFKSILMSFFLSFAMVGAMAADLFPVATTYNIGAGAVVSSDTDKNVQATASVGVEVVGEFSWVAGDLGITSTGSKGDLAYNVDTKVGLVYGKFRPYTSLGYSKSDLTTLGNSAFSGESAIYGVGVRYDLSKSVFLDAAYKTPDGANDMFTAKVHYKFN